MGNRKKKKRSTPQKQVGSHSAGNGGDGRVVSSLTEGSLSASVEEAERRCKEGNGEAGELAAEVLSGLSDNGELHASCSSFGGSSGFGSSSSDGFEENGFMNNGVGKRGYGGFRWKKVVASTGIVSTVIGKDYLGASSRKELVKQRGQCREKIDVEAAEQFLCSMLGDGCELGLAVVRDVLCQCGYDVEKALDILLDLSTSTSESHKNGYSTISSSIGDDANSACGDSLTDRGSDSTSRTSEGEVQVDAPAFNYGHRNYLEAVVTSSASNQWLSNCQRMEEMSPQKVLESLFNVPESSEHDPRTMNWRNVVKKVESFAQKRAVFCPSSNVAEQQANYVKGAEYDGLRVSARQRWDSMKTYYQKAAVAHTDGQREYAAYLSEQGKFSSRLAQKADEKASMEIFKARNQGIGNVLTIDLHGQHVKQAIRLVKLHLLFGTFVSSVQHLRVITGCGTQGVGKSKLKQSVINLIEKEGLQWKEENRGTVLIKLDGPREFSFLDSGSDSD